MGFILLVAVGTLIYITLMHILPGVFVVEDGHEDHDHFGVSNNAEVAQEISDDDDEKKSAGSKQI